MRALVSMIKGILFGWLVGATVGLMYAPRRGEETRSILQEKGRQLRERAVQTVEETRRRAEELTRAGTSRAKEMTQQGQAILREGRMNIMSAVEGVKTGVQTYSESLPEARKIGEETAIQPAPPSDLSTQLRDPDQTI